MTKLQFEYCNTLQKFLEAHDLKRYRLYHDYIIRKLKLEKLFLLQNETWKTINKKPFKKTLGYHEGKSNVVVSLTCTPKRFWMMPFSLCSLFLQDVMPNKIVLTLAREELLENDVPKEISMFQDFGLEILWTEKNTKREKKIHPIVTTLNDNDYLMFGDDDLYYYPNWSSRLVENYNYYNSPVYFFPLKRLIKQNATLVIKSFGFDEEKENEYDPTLLIPGSGMGVCFKIGDCISNFRDYNFCKKITHNDDEVLVWYCITKNFRKLKRIPFYPSGIQWVDYRHHLLTKPAEDSYLSF